MRRSFTPDQRDQFKALKQILDAKTYENKKLFSRELALLKQLRKSYEPIRFWLGLRPAIPLDSLLYFYSTHGRAALDEEWHQFTFSQAQKKADLDQDLERDIAKLERSLAVDNSVDTTPKTNTLKTKKQSTVDWIDS